MAATQFWLQPFTITRTGHTHLSSITCSLIDRGSCSDDIKYSVVCCSSEPLAEHLRLEVDGTTPEVRDSNAVLVIANDALEVEIDSLVDLLYRYFPSLKNLHLHLPNMLLTPPPRRRLLDPEPKKHLDSLVVEDMQNLPFFNLFHLLQHFATIKNFGVLSSSVECPRFKTHDTNLESLVEQRLQFNAPKIEKVVMMPSPYARLFYAMLKRISVAEDVTSLRLVVSHLNELPLLGNLLGATRRLEDLTLEISPSLFNPSEEESSESPSSTGMYGWMGLTNSLENRHYLKTVVLSIPIFETCSLYPQVEHRSRELNKLSWWCLLSTLSQLNVAVEDLSIEWVINAGACDSGKTILDDFKEFWREHKLEREQLVAIVGPSLGRHLKTLRMGLSYGTSFDSQRLDPSTMTAQERVHRLQLLFNDPSLAEHVQSGRICWMG